MIVTENKPMQEILEALGEDKNIFLVACNGCAEVCETGGEEALIKMKEEVAKAGKAVTGAVLVDFLCNKMLVHMRLSREMDAINKSDSLLILTCGIGVQAVANVIDKPVYTAINTISLGGFQGLWPSDERCEACGDCSLDFTGGICPVTSCSKSLLNGPCGGAQDGKCEIDKEKDCGWIKIYERLKETGRLDNLKKTRAPRNHDKMIPSAELRKSPFYDIEQKKQPAPEEAAEKPAKK